MAKRSTEEVRERLYAAAADPGADLAAGALWIAAEEYPDLEPSRYLDFLKRLADRLRRSVPASAPSNTWQHALATEIFGRERFAGNAADYYDPRNSYLNDVIDRRLGIPITLAVVYLSVARALGRSAVGLNTPGHFLLLDDGLVLDPFNGARPVERDVLLAQIEQAGAPDPAAHLAYVLDHPPDNRAILARMLANLRGSHLRRRDLPRALAAVDRLVLLDPDTPAWLRDRGALFQQLECPRAAAADFEAYLARVPDDPEAAVLRQAIARLTTDLPPLQ